MKRMQPDYSIVYRIYRRRRRRRILLAVVAFFLAVMAFGAVALFDMTSWQSLDVSKIVDVDQSLILYDRYDAEVTTLHASEDRIWVALDDIPKYTRDAFISAEDARFYTHFGVDVIRIFGAAWADIKSGSFAQGASTLSQQLIKLSHLSNEKQMRRKIEEAVLAYQLERIYTKDQILEMYLNYVYFGGGYYGVEAAARGYYGVSAGELTVAQSAQLAGILKSPTRFAPHLRPEASVGRRNVVLSLMEEYGYINAEQSKEAKAEEVVLADGAGKNRRGSYVDLALTEACEKLGVDMDTLLTGGYRIYTSMDPAVQAACNDIFDDENNFPADVGGTPVEAAMAVLDVQTGGIAAIRGGRSDDIALSYNRAVRIRRQPGSVIKPVIVYAPALEAGYTAATMLLDEQMSFGDYVPRNANGTYSGWVTMREAVTRSLNVPAVAVMNRVGLNTCKEFAGRLGIEFDETDDSLVLALGGFTYGVSPLQVAGAFSVFGSGGIYNEPSCVRRVCDRDGNVVYQSEAAGARVMSEANAYVLTSMLESVVEEGTGHRLSGTDIPLAGKTGTTGDAVGNRDVWMAAYNPTYAATVWIGFDDSAYGRMLPENVTGGTYPALILKTLFERIYADAEPPNFTMPRGVREYRIDSHTLESEHTPVLANALTPEEESYAEVFVVGTEPDAMTSYWQIPLPPTHITVTASDRLALVYFETPSRYMLYRLYRENNEGKSVLVGTFSGEGGSVAFTDETIKQPGTYSYYVIGVHPQLEIGGQLVAGDASARVSVNIY